MTLVYHGYNSLTPQIELLIRGLKKSRTYKVLTSKLGTRQFARSSVFHFHAHGHFSRVELQKLKYIKEAGRARILHFWGREVRSQKEATITNPYSILLDNFRDEKRILSYLKTAKHFFSACVVPNKEMAQYVNSSFDRVYILPYAVELKESCDYPKLSNTIPLIVHDTPQDYPKETMFIEESLNILAKEGYQFSYQRLNHFDPADRKKILEQADLVIDQILTGAYTPFAVEAMALGKLVFSYIREDLRNQEMNQIPILSVNPATFRRNISSFLENPESYQVLAAQAINYTKQTHELSQITQYLEWVYHQETHLKVGKIRRG